MISIIIIVKNDPKIENTLSKLEQLTSSIKREIIVVDASQGLLNKIKELHPNVSWIPFYNKKKKKLTIPDQRNIGIKASKGDIVVFIDSDCTPKENWLEEITKLITDGIEQIVAGRVIVEDQDSIHQLVSQKNQGEKYIGECPTMNVAYSIDVFKKIGYFDESFKFGSDVDISWRAIKAGFKIRLNPRAIIYHDLGDFKHELRRMYVYGSARIRLYKKHTYRIKYLGEEILKIIYPMYFIFLPITFYFPIYPLIGVLIFINNPGKSLKARLKSIIMKSFYGLGMLRGLITS